MNRSHSLSVCFHAPLSGCIVADRTRALPSLPRPPSPPPPLPGPSHEIQARKDLQAFEKVMASLQATAARCESQYATMLGEMQRAAVELAIAVASRVLLTKVESGDFPLEAIVRHIVGRLPVRGNINVYLHPEDLAMMLNRLGDRPLILGAPAIHFHADYALAHGECRASAAEVTVRSDVMTQLADLREYILEGIPGC